MRNADYQVISGHSLVPTNLASIPVIPQEFLVTVTTSFLFSCHLS